MWRGWWPPLQRAASSAAPLLLHLIIVASVFDIYFKSPIVSVPEPDKPEVVSILVKILRDLSTLSCYFLCT
jgi:hypothetical protein